MSNTDKQNRKIPKSAMQSHDEIFADASWQETPDQVYIYSDSKGDDYVATADGKTVRRWDDVIADIFR